MNATKHAALVRLRIVVRGAVQGIGFRPFVYRLARTLELGGNVANSPYGVVIDVEGPAAQVRDFKRRLHTDKPPLARIEGATAIELAPGGAREFAIGSSEEEGEAGVFPMPDIAVCADCLREMRDPTDRRYRYPFINCTHCGPRFSIMFAVPYDRPNTSMRSFRMCARCRGEYEDPSDRRFHAQPIACPACGPALSVWGPSGDIYASHHDALLMAATEVRAGRIVAIKGVGGFQLVVDARNAHAIAALRERKRRDEKPFAIMYPDLDMLHADCAVSPLESALLASPESPIVLLERKAARSRVAQNAAPGLATLGVMLPYSPLHHLLMDELGFPVVATSGNRSDEPMCIDEREALERLGGIADFFLVHDRPIVRQMDDAIVRMIGGRESVLRRARGYAPLPIAIDEDGPTVVAYGAHLKNAVAIARDGHAFLGQHIGDLESVPAHDAFLRETAGLQSLFACRPAAVACDAHPDYLSSKHARAAGLPVIEVQHHYAHVLACMAEHQLEGPVLGVSWDGTGLGTDNTVWGGEFLRADRDGFARAAHLRAFRLPGGDAAAREPRRAAFAILSELYCLDEIASLPTLRAFDEAERANLATMLERNVNAPPTTSAGRLFDAVASIVGVCQRTSHEGQAGMALESLAQSAGIDDTAYAFELRETGGVVVLDWAPVVRAIVSDVRRAEPPARISARFHGALADAIVRAAQAAQLRDVVLTGGCFQNAVLANRTIELLGAQGFRVHWHRSVPPNDGGLALGQAMYAVRRARMGASRTCV